jgi:hypothetical protein
MPLPEFTTCQPTQVARYRGGRCRARTDDLQVVSHKALSAVLTWDLSWSPGERNPHNYLLTRSRSGDGLDVRTYPLPRAPSRAKSSPLPTPTVNFSRLIDRATPPAESCAPGTGQAVRRIVVLRENELGDPPLPPVWSISRHLLPHRRDGRWVQRNPLHHLTWVISGYRRLGDALKQIAQSDEHQDSAFH